MKRLFNDKILALNGEPLKDANDQTKSMKFFDICTVHLTTYNAKGKEAIKILKLAQKLVADDLEFLDVEDAEFELVEKVVESSQEKMYSPVALVYGRCAEILEKSRQFVINSSE